MTWNWKTARRVVVFVIGMTVVLFGLALLVLPGPAFLVIPVGLAILATEFVWAKVLLERVKERATQMAAKVKRGSGRPCTEPDPAIPPPETSPPAASHDAPAERL